MTKVKDIIKIIEEYAPRNLAESWDNPGLAVGDEQAEAERILVALDCDMAVLEEAIEKKCNMIVTHHPLLFHPIHFVTTETEIGRIVLKAAKHDIAVYSAHTNLDCAKGGVNDTLCRLLDLENVQIMEEVAEGNLIRTGRVAPQPFNKYAKYLCGKFGKPYIRCVGDPEKIIRTVGICSGGGGEFIPNMADKCDLYITGDVKYHMARVASETGLCLAVVEHFESESCVMDIFRNMLEKSGVEIIKSQANRDVMFDILR